MTESLCKVSFLKASLSVSRNQLLSGTQGKRFDTKFTLPTFKSPTITTTLFATRGLIGFSWNTFSILSQAAQFGLTYTSSHWCGRTGTPSSTVMEFAPRRLPVRLALLVTAPPGVIILKSGSGSGPCANAEPTIADIAHPNA